MACLDKLYLKEYKDYQSFKNWCSTQPLLTDKYGNKESLLNYVLKWDEEQWGDNEHQHVVFSNSSYYVDAYLIRNCPIKSIQEELYLRYQDYYNMIREGKMYNTPSTSLTYNEGKHFICTEHPKIKYNKPFGSKRWFVNILLPDGIGYMDYHKHTHTWDFTDEYVIDEWHSNTCFCGSIRALKRLMLKWKLPIGTMVFATGMYIGDTYEFKIIK